MKIDSMSQSSGFESVAIEDVAITTTLKASHYKSPPLICYAAGFVGGQGAKAGSIGYETEKSATLRAGITTDVVYYIERQGRNT